MIRATKLTMLCAFVFGLSFSATASTDYDLICLSSCQQTEIEKCRAAGGGDECNYVNFDHCYYQCSNIIP
ncbi:hypothetical protein [Lysobacter capsici]|uniref:hypothetical protein n=1 Tax=Lysobacter capsici TaxID=435897 RepID=UPI000627BFEB|nr:hypothetical protein [Lysobacter capsici]